MRGDLGVLRTKKLPPANARPGDKPAFCRYIFDSHTGEVRWRRCHKDWDVTGQQSCACSCRLPAAKAVAAAHNTALRRPCLTYVPVYCPLLCAGAVLQVLTDQTGADFIVGA